MSRRAWQVGIQGGNCREAAERRGMRGNGGRGREAEELLDMRRKQRREGAAGCWSHSSLRWDKLRRRSCGGERELYHRLQTADRENTEHYLNTHSHTLTDLLQHVDGPECLEAGPVDS